MKNTETLTRTGPAAVTRSSAITGKREAPSIATGMGHGNADCWCKPRKVRTKDGALLVVHRQYTDGDR